MLSLPTAIIAILNVTFVGSLPRIFLDRMGHLI